MREPIVLIFTRRLTEQQRICLLRRIPAGHRQGLKSFFDCENAPRECDGTLLSLEQDGGWSRIHEVPPYSLAYRVLVEEDLKVRMVWWPTTPTVTDAPSEPPIYLRILRHTSRAQYAAACAWLLEGRVPDGTVFASYTALEYPLIQRHITLGSDTKGKFFGYFDGPPQPTKKCYVVAPNPQVHVLSPISVDTWGRFEAACAGAMTKGPSIAHIPKRIKSKIIAASSVATKTNPLVLALGHFQILLPTDPIQLVPRTPVMVWDETPTSKTASGSVRTLRTVSNTVAMKHLNQLKETEADLRQIVDKMQDELDSRVKPANVNLMTIAPL